MNKRTKFKALLKPLSLVCMSSLLAVTLTSCGTTEEPYDGINPNEKYLQLGNYSVSNKELYNELRWQGTSFVDEKIGEALTKKYYEQVVKTIENPTTEEEIENHKEYVETIQEKIIFGVFNISDLEEQVQHLKNNPYSVNQAIPKFVDSLYQNENIVITEAEVKTLVKWDDIINYNGEFELGLDYTNLTTAQKAVFELYYDVIAQKLFAYDYLEEEIKEYTEEMEDGDDPYFSDAEIKTYWNNNYEYDLDVEALLIRFASQDEANEVLKSFGLKTYRNNLYFVKPDVYRDGEDVTLSNAEYSKYYDEFDFTKASQHEDTYVNLSGTENEGLVLAIYLEIYNYVYSYRNEQFAQTIPGADYTISNRRHITKALIANFTRGVDAANLDNDLYVDDNGKAWNPEKVYDKFVKNFDGYDTYISYTKDELQEINGGLQTYVHSTLVVDTENSSKNKRFSVLPQSYGSSTYLAYKYSQEELTDNVLVFTDEVEKDEIDHEKSKELVDKIIEELKDEILTDSYIQNALTSKKEDVKVKIYDEALEIMYSAGNAEYSKTRGDADKANTILEITYEKKTSTWTVKDLWDEYEHVNGISSALSLISKDIFMDSPEFAEIAKDDEKTEMFYQNLDALLTTFTAGNLSSSGYPATIGKHNFLMMYFHTSDIDRIIDTYYRLNEVSARLLTDYTSLDLASFFKKYTDNYYNNYFSLGATNLLVYVDMDEDGTADRDFDWTQTLKDAPVSTFYGQCNTYKDLAIALIHDIMNILDHSADTDVNTLNTIVTEFNSSSRFENGHNSDIVDGEYNPTETSKYWAKYRSSGLFIKTETLTGVSNDSDYATVNDVLKLALFKAYNEDYLFDGDTAPNEYLVDEYYTGTNPEGLLNVHGFNLPVITSAKINESAEFTQIKDDKDGIYQNLVYKYNDEYYVVDNVYSNSDNVELLTEKQIVAYLLQQASGSTSILPTQISSALSSYLQPVLTKYSSETTQFILLTEILKVMTDSQMVFGNADNADRYVKILEISKRVEDGYKISGNVYGSNVQYTFFKDAAEGENPLDIIGDLYIIEGNENWWTSVEKYIKNSHDGKDGE